MNAPTLASTLSRPHTARISITPDPEAIRTYFAETQDDYFAWSRGHNMHFGYFEPGMDPFDREAMVERMNTVAIDALAIDALEAPVVADLGCGSGATARALARRHAGASVTGVTFVHEQIVLGCRLNRDEGLQRRIGYLLSDFADTGMASASHDGAYAIESFCYGAGEDKAGAIREAYRLLKPGGRLVVVDGFLRGDREPSGLTSAVYRAWCRGWALPGLARLDAFTAALAREGFIDVRVRDIFWNIAVCATHVPWVATLHTLRELRRNRGLSPQRRRHILASWLSVALGLARHAFTYSILVARKPN